jgi:hypothetical protein
VVGVIIEYLENMHVVTMKIISNNINSNNIIQGNPKKSSTNYVMVEETKMGRLTFWRRNYYFFF